MLFNTILMHGLRENRGGRFYWLTQPAKQKTDYHGFYEESPVMDNLSPIVRSQIKCCAHDGSCDSFIYQVNKKKQKFHELKQKQLKKIFKMFFRELKSFSSLVLVWRLHEASSIIMTLYCEIH